MSLPKWAYFGSFRFTNKIKSIIMSLNFSSNQLARISLAEFVSKLILIKLDFVNRAQVALTWAGGGVTAPLPLYQHERTLTSEANIAFFWKVPREVPILSLNPPVPYIYTT